MKAYLAEFIGTFFLVFLGTGAIVLNEVTNGVITHVGVSAVFGIAVVCMIYLFGKFSGSHINPAVTVSLYSVKMFSGRQVVPYVIAQFMGAVTASVLLHFVFPLNQNLGRTMPSGSLNESFLLEFLMSFILMLVILISSSQKQMATWIPGLLIGITVGLEAYFGGGISGASMNPIRSIGPALISGKLQALWIYIIAPTIGMLAASFIWFQLKKKMQVMP